MGRTDVSKPINLWQLEAELQVKESIRFIGGQTPTAIECDALTDQQLAAAVAAHMPNPDFGKTPEQKEGEAAMVEIAKLRAKAKAVLAGTDTFTPAQVQKLLTLLVLQTTR